MKWIIEHHILYDYTEGVLEAPDGRKVDLKYNENVLLSKLVSGFFDKHVLMEAVWGKLIVTDSSYHKLIFELRAQFERIGLDPKLIKTVPRRGCMFVGVCEPSGEDSQEDTKRVSDVRAEVEATTHLAVSDLEQNVDSSLDVSLLKDRSKHIPLRERRAREFLFFILVAFLGLASGWLISDFLPSLYINKIKKDNGLIYVVGLLYKDVPKLPGSSGDVFYIKNRKGTSIYYCDKHDGSDLNCKNQISF
ncbi:hypothetical protein [Chromobacterium amazonense]|uniref:transcriptional regulator n=1 Tax=Chromobacterium amazonense TaxID=1382803 RepID=UPI0031F68E2F